MRREAAHFLGALVREIRTRHQLTRAGLARRLGCHHTTIWRIEAQQDLCPLVSFVLKAMRQCPECAVQVLMDGHPLTQGHTMKH